MKRYILMGLALLLLIWFLLPLLFGILNAGNGIGIAFSALLLFYSIKMPKIHDFLQKNAQKTWIKVLHTLLWAVVCIGIIFTAVCSLLIAGSVHRPAPGETTVVVLGCQVRADGPSLMLSERLIAAERYLKENPEAKCILSGGQGVDEPMSEAVCMYRYLTGHGIDAKRLYLEDKSTSTRENLKFSQKIIREEGLPREITIITNDFHQYRARRIAASLGIESYSVSGKTQIFLFPTYFVREIGGILYELVLSW